MDKQQKLSDSSACAASAPTETAPLLLTQVNDVNGLADAGVVEYEKNSLAAAGVFDDFDHDGLAEAGIFMGDEIHTGLAEVGVFDGDIVGVGLTEAGVFEEDDATV